jgi:peroxiredoxin/ribosomal protein S18 acetylase RimI-like enzyme
MAESNRAELAKTIDMAAVGPPHVRALEAVDATAFRGLRLRALREDPGAFLTTHDEDAASSVEEFAARLKASTPGTEVLGAFRGDELVGSLGYYRHVRLKAHHRVTLWGMYVAGEERRRGVGRALVEEAVRRLRALGDVEQIELAVVSREMPAHELYVKLGFQIQGTTRRAMKVGREYHDEDMLVLWLGDVTNDPKHPLPEGLPPPKDDGAAAHLAGAHVPDVALPSTAGGALRLGAMPGRTVVFVYPRMSPRGEPLAEAWRAIPGAAGCTPEACAFRDRARDLGGAGVRVVGLSSQVPEEQREAALRLRLPYPLVSDQAMRLAKELKLPTFEHEGKTFLRRVTMVVDDGKVTQVFYPVFPPDKHPEQVLAWLRAHPRQA